MNEQRFNESRGRRIYSSGPLSGNLEERVAWQNTAPFPKMPASQTSQPYGPDTERTYRVKPHPATDALPHSDPRHQPYWLAPLIFLSLILFVIGTVFIGLRAARVGVTSVTLSAREFSISGPIMLNIHDDVGSVHVHTGKGGLITVRATVDKDIFGMQPGINYDQIGNTFNLSIDNPALSWLSASSVALDITVPVAVNLAITVDSADITVNEVQGKLTVNDHTGNVSISGTTLSGNGSIVTTTGNVSINSKFADGAQYKIKTDTGNIGNIFPGGAHTHIRATSNTGNIESDVQGVKTASTSAGQQASSDIGGANPPSSLTMASDSGSITLRGD